MSTRLERRTVLQGALVLAFALGAPPLFRARAEEDGPPGDLAKHPQLDAWLRIGADGRVTLKTGKVELGQGILTAFAQLCAEELDVDLSRVDLVSGDTRRSPDQGATAGSQSMPEGGVAVRAVAAEARSLLLTMAAERLKRPVGQLRVNDGTIRDGAGGESLTYWALMGDRTWNRRATGTVAPKPASERRYLGRSVPRVDLPGKVLGEPSFVHDLRPAGLVHGRVIRAPSPGAVLLEADEAGVKGLPGVLAVVRDGSFLGVIAGKEWQAHKAAARLAHSARWREEARLPEDPYAWLLAQTSEDTVIEHVVRPPGGPEPVRTLEASYRRPYVMHGSIGPSCAVAAWDGDVLTLHSHSQTLFETCEAIAKLLGLPADKVWGRHLSGSGCYGHNGADDVAADAALLARALPGRPVRVQWSREDEHTHEPYGPAMVTQVRASLDAAGRVLDWNYELWSTSHGSRPGGEPGNLLAGTALASPFTPSEPRNGGPPNYSADRNALPLYAFAGRRVTTHFVKAMPLRTSSLRALGAVANVFSLESFMDELAHAAGVEPLAFRLRHLEDPRARDVLRRAAERLEAPGPLQAPHHGRGLAFARYKNLATYCAVGLEVSVEPGTHVLRVTRAVVAADAGEIVNPDGLANQLEGGLLQTLSACLKEEVHHDTRRVLSRDWSRYPLLTFSEAPPVEVVLLDQPGAPFLGAGEAAQGPTAAALANALFAATGLRARQLPFTPERLAALR